MNNLMIDLETLGTKPGAVVIAIGACFFEPTTGQIGEKFYQNIDWQSCVDKGCEIDVDTIHWWMQQSDEARQAILKPGDPLEFVLAAFSEWILQNTQTCYPWGNGATFDISMIEDLYDRCDNLSPWKFWNVRDCRTVEYMAKGLVDKKSVKREGTHHNALDDAIYQAQYISKMVSYFI